MSESEAAVVYFWMAVMLWDHAKSYADTKMKPAPNVMWFIERFIAVCFYFQAFRITLHWLAEWTTS